MLVWLYGEMRDALWPERGLSGSVAGSAADVAFPPATRCDGAPARMATARRLEVLRSV